MSNIKRGAIWAVTSGEYSDYQVLAMFEDEETASFWARQGPTDQFNDWRIEQFDLVPSGCQPYTVTEYSITQELWDDGKEGELRTGERTESAIDALFGEPPFRPSVRFVRAPVHHGKGGRLEVRGSHRQAVMKVYQERLTVWRAAPRQFGKGEE